MKENLALDKYSDNVFPGALLIGLNAGPASDLRDEDDTLLSPPALARPFSHSEMFKDVPTAKTPTAEPEDDGKAPEEFDLISGDAAKPESPSPSPSPRTRTHANVIFNIQQAVNLPPMDGGLFSRNPQSDPYVEIVIENKKTGKKREKECEPIKKNLNPVWNQMLRFDNVAVGDTIHLRVMDWDAGPDPDDEMGNIKPLTVNGRDFDDWIALIPSKEAQKKFKKKKSRLEGMKIKIGIKYDWDVDPDAGKKKKGLLGGLAKSMPKLQKKKSTAFVDKLSEPERRPMQLRYIYMFPSLHKKYMHCK